MNRKLTLWIVFILGAGVMLALDLWLKIWSETNQVMLRQDRPYIINGFLGMTYFENSGAAFGLAGGFAWSQVVLSIVKTLLLLGVLWYYHRLSQLLEKKYWLVRIPVIMIFAGGVGNLFDRITLGVVRDMLEFLFVNFAIFNLADVFVVAGVISWGIFDVFIVKHLSGTPSE